MNAVVEMLEILRVAQSCFPLNPDNETRSRMIYVDEYIEKLERELGLYEDVAGNFEGTDE